MDNRTVIGVTLRAKNNSSEKSLLETWKNKYIEIIEDPDLVAGHAVAPLEHVWESRLALRRLKDMPHLRAIAVATGRPSNFPEPIYVGPGFDS